MLAQLRNGTASTRKARLILISPDELNIDQLRAMLRRWAEYNKGHVGPQGYPKMSVEQSAHIGHASDPEWPDDVVLIERGLTALKNKDDREKKRRVRILMVEYRRWRPLADRAKSMGIRRDDYHLVLDEAERALLDIVTRLLGAV